MAKIKLANIDPRALTSVLGSCYIRDTRWGTIVQSKPRYSKSKRTELQQDYINRFTFAGRMAATPEPLSYQTAMFLSQGTEQVPRDILTMAALGTYYNVAWPDGTPVDHAPGPLANTRPEVENSMWEWSQWDAARTSTMDATAAASKGNFFTPFYNDTIYAVRAILTTVNLAQYQISFGLADGTDHITTITRSTPVIAVGASLQCLQFPITYTFTANVRNFMMLSRIDSTNTYALPVNITQAAHWLYPVTNWATFRLAKAVPLVGDLMLGISAVNAQPIGFRINQ